MSDNGSTPSTDINLVEGEDPTTILKNEVEWLKEQLEEAKKATLAEPVQATLHEPTPMERQEACFRELNEILAKYNCRLATTWVSVSPNQQVRSDGVTIEPNIIA